MSKLNERTFQMTESFIELHEKGFGVPEIAKKFNLSESTVYRKLGEIAQRAGVTRESLLEKPMETDHSGRHFAPVKPVSTDAFFNHFSLAMSELDNLVGEVGKTIENHETISELMKEEFSK